MVDVVDMCAHAPYHGIGHRIRAAGWIDAYGECEVAPLIARCAALKQEARIIARPLRPASVIRMRPVLPIAPGVRHRGRGIPPARRGLDLLEKAAEVPAVEREQQHSLLAAMYPLLVPGVPHFWLIERARIVVEPGRISRRREDVTDLPYFS